jgi:hypothetical protein
MTVAWESFNENYSHPLHFNETDSFHAQKCECASVVKVENLDTELHSESGGFLRGLQNLEEEKHIPSLKSHVVRNL